MINSTLTLNNFFVLRLRNPNPFDSENLDVGNSFNQKLDPTPFDPQSDLKSKKLTSYGSVFF